MAQSEALNRKDDDQRKQGYWIYYGKDRPASGIPADGKVEEGRYINDRKEGKWIKYHDDGVHPRIIGYYQNNRPKGCYEKYYISGQLKEKGHFEKNFYVDTLTCYREDGTIEYQGIYDKAGTEIKLLAGESRYREPIGSGGKVTEFSGCGSTWGDKIQKAVDTINRSDEKGKQGHWIYYGKDRPESGIPADGKVEEGNYVDDRKEGIWIKYHIDGKTPKLIGRYENNRPHGHYDKYNIDGTFRDSGDFSNIHRGSYHSLRRGGAYDPYTAYATTHGSAMPANDLPDSLKLYPPQLSGNPNMGTYAPKLFQPDGYNKIYNEDNEIWLDGIFKNGQLWDGKVYFYDRDWILLSVSYYKEGKYFREGQL